MKKRRAVVVVACAAAATVMAVIAVAGCSSGEQQPALEGTSWKLSGWAESFSWPADVTITADFDESKVSGSSGVNRYFGEYKRDGDGAFSAGPIGSTMMAGPEAAMKAEQAYVHRLEAARSYAVTGDTLVLKGADGKDSLTFTASN
jgi:heat shock protein HslJ